MSNTASSPAPRALAPWQRAAFPSDGLGHECARPPEPPPRPGRTMGTNGSSPCPLPRTQRERGAELRAHRRPGLGGRDEPPRANTRSAPPPRTPAGAVTHRAARRPKPLSAPPGEAGHWNGTHLLAVAMFAPLPRHVKCGIS